MFEDECHFATISAACSHHSRSVRRVNRVVIVGGGLAAGSAAATLREEGFDGSIVIVGEESLLPYDRPPLSKAVLRGEEPDLRFKADDDFWSENRIEVMLGVRATSLDPNDRMIYAGTQRLPFDALLIATGGRPRMLPVPGAGLNGIHLLRTLGDAVALRDAATAAQHVVVVGMGFIGAEVAASLRSIGKDVTAVEPFAVPLERVLGRQVGASVARLHADHGVRMLMGTGVDAFEGSERVERVVTGDGRRIDADLVVAGVGMVPNIEWLEGSGITMDNGVVVDARCMTRVPGIFAAGDVARHDHPRFGSIRVEHWQNALKQGAAAARSMLGRQDPYDEVHWFWSDQYDASLQYTGHHAGTAEIVFRGDPADPPFLAYYMHGGIVQAAFGFNSGREVRAAKKLIGKPLPDQ